MGEFIKGFDQANKVSQIPLPKPKFEIGFTKAENELFSHCYKVIVEHLNRQIILSFRFQKNKTCVFSNKNFEQYGDQFVLTGVVNLSYREIKHLYKNRFLLLTSVTFLRAIKMCSAFTLIVGMTIALLYSLETCIVQIQSVWVNIACTKTLFNLSTEAIINVRNARLCVKCAIFLLKNKQIPFSCRLVKVFTFLKRVQNQFKMLLEMCFVPESFVSTERSANLLLVM